MSTPEQVIADALLPALEDWIVAEGNQPQSVWVPDVSNCIVAALRAAGLLPGPHDIVVSREALTNLVAHVKHDVVCTVFDEEYMGSECCRHGTCAEAEANDEIHGTRAGTPRRHPALTDAVRAALSQPHPAQEQQT